MHEMFKAASLAGRKAAWKSTQNVHAFYLKTCGFKLNCLIT